MSATTTATTEQQHALSLTSETPNKAELNTSPSLISKIHIIPTFEDKYAERKWAKEHMAGAFRLWAKLGYNDGAGGHISLRDPVHPDCFWINPYAVHFGLIKASDMILVNGSGEPLTPTKHKVNTAGFMIHAALHKARPDINAAAHTHSPYGRAWSTFGKPIEMLNQDSCYFYNDLAVYEGFGGIVLAKEEGERIAAVLGPKMNNCILQNHGILTCGGTVDEAVGAFVALEQACQAQLLADAAAANGYRQKKLVGDKEAAFTKLNGGPAVLYMQFQPEYDMLLEETKGSFLN